MTNLQSNETRTPTYLDIFGAEFYASDERTHVVDCPVADGLERGAVFV